MNHINFDACVDLKMLGSDHHFRRFNNRPATFFKSQCVTQVTEIWGVRLFLPIFCWASDETLCLLLPSSGGRPGNLLHFRNRAVQVELCTNTGTGIINEIRTRGLHGALCPDKQQPMDSFHYASSVQKQHRDPESLSRPPSPAH